MFFKLVGYAFLLILFYVLGFNAGQKENNKGNVQTNIKIHTKSRFNTQCQRKSLVYTGASDIVIDYIDVEGQKTNREIHIIEVYNENDCNYLKAFCKMRNDVRNFKIENIQKMYIGGAEISSPRLYFSEKIER